MDKQDLETLVNRLRQLQVEDKYIPALVMTAYYESNLSYDAVNTNKDGTKDIGFFQINAASFYDKKGNPDPTLKRFFATMGDREELTQDAFEDKLLGEKYNTAFAAHIIKDFHEHSSKDPFGKWTAYTQYVRPFLQGDPIPNKSIREQVNGIGAYMDSYLYIHGLQEKEDIKKAFSNPKVKVLDGFMGKIKANQ